MEFNLTIILFVLGLISFVLAIYSYYFKKEQRVVTGQRYENLNGERLNLRNNENIRVIYPHRPHVSFDVSPIESTSPSNANDSAFHSNTTNINSEELLLRVNDRLNRNINYGTNSISLNIVFEERPPSYIEAMLRATSTPNDEETPQ